MPLIPERLWISPLTRAYEAESNRLVVRALWVGVALAAIGLAIGLLGGLDLLTLSLVLANLFLAGWGLGYEWLAWRLFGIGSLYMSWVQRGSLVWWRSIGLRNRSTPHRAAIWLERHADDLRMTEARAVVNLALGRLARARAEIALVDDGTATGLWRVQRLCVYAARVEGNDAHAEVEALRKAIAELDHAEGRLWAEADLVGMEVIQSLQQGGDDWIDCLRIGVDRVNREMALAGKHQWQFRLRFRDWLAFAGGIGVVIALYVLMLIA